jgi:hypothetical protein
MDTSTITVEAWVRADTTPSGSVIASRVNWNYAYGNRYAWALSRAGGHFCWQQFVNGGSTPTAITAPDALQPGQV